MPAKMRAKSKALIEAIIPKWALKEIRSLSHKTAVPFPKMRDVILGLGIYAAKEQMSALMKEMDAVPNLLKSAIELAKLDPNVEPNIPDVSDSRSIDVGDRRYDDTRQPPEPVIHKDRAMPADQCLGTPADPTRSDHAVERPEEPGADYTLDGYVSALPRGDVLGDDAVLLEGQKSPQDHVANRER